MGEKSKQLASTSDHDEVWEKEDRGDVSVVNGSALRTVHACQQECEGNGSGLVGLGKDRIHLGFTENADEMRVMFLMGDPKKRGVRFGLREGKLDRVAMASVET
ncbi:putative inactive purple acid phosphatase 9 [Quercus suber]|uniref:Inactive purple acid phosphatase 9 n=1 Tax=Quercus suber TaxID=58331 RepID=A0AAW0J0D0_QUESU